MSDILDTHPDTESLYRRIGELTRTLHDALRELGYDKSVEQAVNALPDARARLDYIANLTGSAAERALAAAERGKSVQDQLDRDAKHLVRRWDNLYAHRTPLVEFEDIVGDTRTFLASASTSAETTNAQFLEVMMAQDFHDLTGQVIHRIVGLAQTIEEQLLKLLIEATPPDKRVDAETGLLNGPVVDARGRDDVVTSQAQVDDLLANLGF